MSSCVSGTEILVIVRLNNFLRAEGILSSKEGLCFVDLFGWYRLH